MRMHWAVHLIERMKNPHCCGQRKKSTDGVSKRGVSKPIKIGQILSRNLKKD